MSKTDNTILWKYAGMAMQFFIAIGLSLFIGSRLDQWAGTSRLHIFALALPLLTIVGLIIKVFIDTQTKKNNENK